jgi:hypothetical protein
MNTSDWEIRGGGAMSTGPVETSWTEGLIALVVMGIIIFLLLH